MKTRADRKRLAEETLAIIDDGRYVGKRRMVVELSERVQSAVDASVLYEPDDFASVKGEREKIMRKNPPPFETNFQVVNETTLSASERLLRADSHRRVLALNFASAKNPGGGFLRGSRAQEESLALSSALYPCLTKHMSTMYYHNRTQPMDGLYSDHMILSPDVPVFRDDDGRLLTEPYLLSFITAPAVNAGLVRKKGTTQADEIRDTMLRRMEKVLSVALVNKYDSLVLGGWGCGVFGNDASDIANQFAHWLRGHFAGRFDLVVFAVLDNKQEKVIQPFRERFQS